MDIKQLGKKIKNARTRSGYTQAELAEKIGFSIQHLSHIENGSTKMSIECLLLISEVLDISLDDLFERNIRSLGNLLNDIVSGCSGQEREFIYQTILTLKKELDVYNKIFKGGK